MKLYLHIGIEKTGTSSIQSFLHENRKLLLEKYKILYPVTGLWVDKSHHDLAFSAINSKLHTDNPKNFDSLFMELTDEIEQSNCESVLISSEIFRGLHETIYFDIFIRKLQTYFSEIELLVFLRDQPYWLLSMYNQYVKDLSIGYCDKFENFYELMKDKMDYLNMIDRWNEYIGKEKIHIFRYLEKNNNNRRSSIKHIIDFFNFKSNEMVFVENRNISLNRIQLELFRFFNRINLDRKDREFINMLIKNNFNEKAYDYLMNKYAVCSLEFKQKIQESFLESNMKLNLKYLGSDELLFPEIKEEEDSICLNAITPLNISRLIIDAKNGL